MPYPSQIRQNHLVLQLIWRLLVDPAANPPGQSVIAPPTFLATVAQVVKDAFAADRVPGSLDPTASSQPSITTMLGGVPIPSSNLAFQASAFLTSGTGILPASMSSASQGGPSYVVPSFCFYFSNFLTRGVSSLVCLWDFLVSECILASIPSHSQQPFVVGQGL